MRNAAVPALRPVLLVEEATECKVFVCALANYQIASLNSAKTVRTSRFAFQGHGSSPGVPGKMPKLAKSRLRSGHWCWRKWVHAIVGSLQQLRIITGQLIGRIHPPILTLLQRSCGAVRSQRTSFSERKSGKRRSRLIA